MSWTNNAMILIITDYWPIFNTYLLSTLQSTLQYSLKAHKMIKIRIAKVYTFSVIVRSEGMSAVTSTGTAILATTANISFSVMQEL